MLGLHRRCLGFLVLLVIASPLALAGCNSNSVSGSQSETSKATNAEAKSPPSSTKASMKSSRPQGAIGAAISAVK